MLSEKIKEKLMNKMVQELNPAFILLFGSFAKGANDEKSDLDLAYFGDKSLSAYERFLLASELAIIAECEIDLIDMKQIDTVFMMQIFSEGIPVFIQDENEYVRQRMRAYSMYVTLNEQRAPIIEKIQESGRVFDHE